MRHQLAPGGLLHRNSTLSSFVGEVHPKLKDLPRHLMVWHVSNRFLHRFRSLNVINAPSAHSVGRVRLIFKLPPYYSIPDTLALVQIFQVTSYGRPNKRMGMFKVTRKRYPEADGNRTYQEAIIPLSHIRRSCHLVPEFGKDTPIVDSYAPFDALERYETFYLNPFLDLHSFQLLLG